ncbi:MAG: PD-(D/E)XK nuclease family protein, partial [Spirochaetaceae bacterium]|nr:PD-(D/E)XK nuclease family protein [Spirochaetaceae bacterium]
TEQAQLNPGTFGSYEEFIVERYEQYRSRRDLASISFLRILPKLELDNSLYSVEPIYNFDYGVIQNLARRLGGGTNDGSLGMKEAAFRMRPDYAAMPGFPPHHRAPGIVAAGSLKIPGTERELAGEKPVHVPAAAKPALPAGTKPAGTPAQGEFDFAEPEPVLPAGKIPGMSLDSREPEFGDLSAEDFGIIVHGFIESRFNGQAPRIPPRFAAVIGDEKKAAAVKEAASLMVEGFFGSGLGRKALAAPFLRTEYPVLTAVDCGEGTEKAVIVSGRIDLLFEHGGVFYVVDFKTDRNEDITRHIGQLALYKRAVEDIFGKPAECRLFYLRHGYEADPGREIAGTSPEQLVRFLRKGPV